MIVEGFVAFQQKLEWKEHASLNVIIGENDTGKTHLLKLLYAVSRSIEDYSKKRAGPEPKDLSELLAGKLRWTFLPQKMELGRLVSRGAGQRLNVELCWNSDGHLKFGFGKDTTVKMKRLEQLAREHRTDYTLLDLRKRDGGGVVGSVTRLVDGLPMNPIVEESLRLFDKDVQLDLEG